KDADCCRRTKPRKNFRQWLSERSEENIQGSAECNEAGSYILFERAIIFLIKKGINFFGFG
ncbi:MAG: hypothetical protein WBC21_00030, partial [Minisyncoccales bacterium]